MAQQRRLPMLSKPTLRLTHLCIGNSLTAVIIMILNKRLLMEVEAGSRLRMALFAIVWHQITGAVATRAATHYNLKTISPQMEPRWMYAMSMASSLSIITSNW